MLTPDQRRLLDSLSDQAALAIERLHLAEEMDRPAWRRETEKLRSALLTSISHDLRTPLASILGSATSLKQYRDQLDDAGAGRTARHHPGGSRAAEPFHRQSAGHDAAGIRRAGAAIWKPVDLGDVVGSVLRRAPGSCRRIIASCWSWNTTCRCCEAGPGAVRAGAVQSAGQCRQICARRHRDHVARAPGRRRASASMCWIEGAGLPEEDRERVFDKFYRVRAGDQPTRRHRTGPCHRARLHGSHGRHHHRRQSQRRRMARSSP